MGFFYYEPLRDSSEVICLAGGSGITPFKAIIPDMLENYSDINVSLVHGVRNEEELIFRSFFDELENKYLGRFRYSVICSEPEPGWDGDRGFLSRDYLLNKFSSLTGKSLFLCGPEGMYRYLDEQLKDLAVPRKYIRRESFGTGRIPEQEVREWSIIVKNGSGSHEITGWSDETVLTSLERAGLNPPAHCRTGECGWCRSYLLKGEVYIPEARDKRRAADRKFRYFHPCVSYPCSDLIMEVPVNPADISPGES